MKTRCEVSADGDILTLTEIHLSGENPIKIGMNELRGIEKRDKIISPMYKVVWSREKYKKAYLIDFCQKAKTLAKQKGKLLI